LTLYIKISKGNQAVVVKVHEKTTSHIWAAKIYDTRDDELINMVWIIKALNFLNF